MIIYIFYCIVFNEKKTRLVEFENTSLVEQNTSSVCVKF